MTTYTTPIDEFDTETSDGALGPEVQFDRDRPPLGTFVFGPTYDGTCFIIKDNLLYFSKPKQPEAWPSLNFIEVGPKQLPGKTGVFYNGQPYYLNESEIWHIQGTGSGLFQPIPTNAKTGAQSVRGAVSIAGHGIFHTGKDGIYLYANGMDRKITEDSLEPIFRGEDAENLPAVGDMSTSWLFGYKNNLYFGYAGDDDDYPTNVLVFNLNSNRLTHYVYNDGSDIEIRTIAVDHSNDRLLVGDNSGFVRVIEKPGNTDDSGTAISWQMQSKDYTLPTRRHFPRWVKYDVDASGASSVTGSLILDGSSHQSHTITGNRNTRRRLVKPGNGNKAAIRIAGTGPATVYTVEFE
jgi:hypothetical protein